MEESFKCLHCGYEYRMEVDTKHGIRERICPKCKSNSVRKISTKK